MGNCSITTRLLANNTTASGIISLCSAEGITPGSAVAGTGSAASRGLLLADGKCLSTADCNAAGVMMCSLSTSPRQLCLCNAATGADECATYGTCVRTPCKVCSDCLTSIGREFVSKQLYETDAAKVAAGFHGYCTSNSLGTAAVCTELAAAINVSTPTGNRGEAQPTMTRHALCPCRQTRSTCTQIEQASLAGLSGSGVVMYTLRFSYVCHVS
jgi:hypothetical protein